MLSDAQWLVLAPLVEACRPVAKVAPQSLRETMSAIVWRHHDGAKWHSVPHELGPRWKAAQCFIRWSRLGVWERLLTLTRECGVQLGLCLLDGTNIRAHHKALGAARKTTLRHNAMIVRHLAALVAGLAPRPA